MQKLEVCDELEEDGDANTSEETKSTKVFPSTEGIGQWNPEDAVGSNSETGSCLLKAHCKNWTAQESLSSIKYEHYCNEYEHVCNSVFNFLLVRNVVSKLLASKESNQAQCSNHSHGKHADQVVVGSPARR